MDSEIIQRFNDMEEKLGKKLDGINTALTKIAVQKTRLDGMERRVDGIWTKWDEKITPFMQACPKEQVKYLWWIVVPMALTQFGMGLVLIKMALT